jgi:hypothetical protein
MWLVREVLAEVVEKEKQAKEDCGGGANGMIVWCKVGAEYRQVCSGILRCGGSMSMRR